MARILLKSSAVSEPSLSAAIEKTRARVLELESKLSRRHAAEAAELELIETQRAQLNRRSVQLSLELAASTKLLGELTLQQRALTQGLSRARRSWVRLGEPVLGSLLVFTVPVCIGLSDKARPLIIVQLLVLGISAGLAVWRQRRVVGS